MFWSRDVKILENRFYNDQTIDLKLIDLNNTIDSNIEVNIG
jgi:hypothetical protein